MCCGSTYIYVKELPTNVRCLIFLIDFMKTCDVKRKMTCETVHTPVHDQSLGRVCDSSTVCHLMFLIHWPRDPYPRPPPGYLTTDLSSVAPSGQWLVITRITDQAGV